ncbi:Uncharacterized protein TCM_046018 [Theobroma cacao]|uniref:Rab3-GAP regulatory subunit N-terminal domain-containing protein n=1 Tax=Theobroma cacao TaxID=3641 RepID=S1SMP7_THECC|nr:Uncharacterized protein TCM_046018 [Theobroma cacao]
MSKRSYHHLTDLGCIAGEDLSEFGAGKEGWLAPDASPTHLCALDAHSLAIANRSLILILGWSDTDEPRVQIRPELSPIEAEHITAIEWLVFDEIKVIAVGTSRGFILVYSVRGDLIHRQKPKKDSEDKGNSYGRLPYQVWNVNKYGTCVDAAITGIMPPPLMELQYILFMLMFVSSMNYGRFLKLFWYLNSAAFIVGQSNQPSPLTCLKDHPRKGEKLTLSPSGTLAAITDSLGRILLLDTQALVVVRLWKGYRDASCFFMEMLVNKEAIGSGSSYYEPGKSDYCLCLAIHAPQKGIVEVWQMRTDHVS